MLDPTASLLLTRTFAAPAEDELVLDVLGNAEEATVDVGVRVEGLSLAALPAATDETTLDAGAVALELALAVLLDTTATATLEVDGLTIDEELA